MPDHDDYEFVTAIVNDQTPAFIDLDDPNDDELDDDEHGFGPWESHILYPPGFHHHHSAAGHILVCPVNDCAAGAYNAGLTQSSVTDHAAKRLYYEPADHTH